MAAHGPKKLFLGAADEVPPPSSSGTSTPSEGGVVFSDVTEGPVSRRAQREEHAAAALGIDTSASSRGPLVAGSMRPGGAFAAAAAASAAAAAAPANGPTVTLAEYKARASMVIADFFSSGDYEEARASLAELGAPAFGFEFVKRLLVAAMAKEDRERELACRLLGALVGMHALSIAQAGKGFERLLESIDDVEKDVPRAREMAGRFLARAVADETLPPAFVVDDYVRSLAGSIADDARALLTLEHKSERLARLFHVSGAHSVPELKQAIELALKEYLSSEDADECVRCIKELRVPFFGHEVVRRALGLALDAISAEAPVGLLVMRVMRLFRALRDAGAVSPLQFERGFARVRAAMSDFQLDSPFAKGHFEAFVASCVAAGILSGPPGNGAADAVADGNGNGR